MVNKKPVKVEVSVGKNGQKCIKDAKGNTLLVQKDAFGNQFIVDQKGQKKFIDDDGVLSEKPKIVHHSLGTSGDLEKR